jgi:Arc/MetJ-type ribon-helix-helix transcriptional regulator
MRTTKSVTISLPPEQLKIAERLAKRSSRTMSELFREGLRRLEREDATPRPSAAELREFTNAVAALREDAKAKGLDKMTMREINTEIEAYRRERDGRRPTKSSRK